MNVEEPKFIENGNVILVLEILKLHCEILKIIGFPEPLFIPGTSDIRFKDLK